MAFISNGTTILDAGAFSVSLGAMVHIKTLTASSSADLSFVHGSSSVVLNNTYPIYKFVFTDIHPATDSAEWTFNLSADTGGNYNVTKTTTLIQTYHNEDEGVDSGTAIQYTTASDMAQSTGHQTLAEDCGNGNDECVSGSLMLFNPSSTTFVKHFMTNANSHHAGNYTQHYMVAGYGNTTSAVDAIQFKFSSGNVDSGTIKLYGIKDS